MGLPSTNAGPAAGAGRSQILDGQQAGITDFGHQNRDEPDVIMAKIREELPSWAAAGPGRAGGRRSWPVGGR